MSSVVVGLDRKPVEVVGELPPVAGIAEGLRDLAAQAERGEIRAIAVAIVRSDRVTSTFFQAPEAEAVSHQLMAAITYLQHRYAAAKLAASV